MAIRIKALQKLLPRKSKTDPEVKRWYPAIDLAPKVSFTEFCEKVSDETTVSSADIKAVFDRVAKVLVRELRSGRSVDLGDLGHFRPSILANLGVEKYEAFSTAQVKGARVVYTPAAPIKRALENISLERADKLLDVSYKAKEGGGETPKPEPGGGEGGI